MRYYVVSSTKMVPWNVKTFGTWYGVPKSNKAKFADYGVQQLMMKTMAFAGTRASAPI